MSSKRSAICLSGQIRHLYRGYDAIYKNIIEPNNCDVFFHVWANTPQEVDLYQSARKLYNPILSITYPQIYFDTLDYDANPYADGNNQSRVFNIHSMWYSINQADILQRIYSGLNQFNYDWVARCRFDWGPTCPMVFKDGQEDSVNIVNDCVHNGDCLTDHFAFGNSENMAVYSSLFHSFPSFRKSGVPFCSEILLGKYLKHHGIKIAQIDSPRQFILH